MLAISRQVLYGGLVAVIVIMFSLFPSCKKLEQFSISDIVRSSFVLLNFAFCCLLSLDSAVTGEFQKQTESTCFIAENMMSQIDSGGHHYQLLNKIQDNRKDRWVVSKANVFITSHSGNRHPKKTTAAANPLELAEYAVTNNINDEPVFNWWVRDAMKLRNRII